jgi:hypothetical protein
LSANLGRSMWRSMIGLERSLVIFLKMPFEIRTLQGLKGTWSMSTHVEIPRWWGIEQDLIAVTLPMSLRTL